MSEVEAATAPTAWCDGLDDLPCGRRYRVTNDRSGLCEECRIATLEAQLAEARGMALTEVTDLLRNVLSRSLVSATEKLIVEVILDKIEALKAGAK